ncbi:MAG: hypothetical protein QG570_431 [Patescibacteria group bacterium]|nr:hypothetical protein [Patescibacteria group bacterium]
MINIKPLIEKNKKIAVIILILFFGGLIYYLFSNGIFLGSGPDTSVIELSTPSINVAGNKEGKYKIERSLYFKVTNPQDGEILPIYNYKKIDFSTDEQLIGKIAEEVGLTKKKEINSVGQGPVLILHSEDNTRGITLNKQTNVLTYSNINYDKAIRYKDVNQIEEARNAAASFLKELNLWSENYSLSGVQYRDDKISAHQPEISPPLTQSTTIEFLFENKIDGYEISTLPYSVQGDYINIAVSADNYTVTKIQLVISSAVSDEQGKVKIISLNDLIKEIDNGNIKLIDTLAEPDAVFDRIVLSEATIFYYAVDNQIVPAYRISGTATDQKGQASPVYFIANAFK